MNNYIIVGENIYSQIIDADPKFNLKACLLNKNSDLNDISNADSIILFRI